MSTVCKVTPLPRPCTLGHTSTCSRVTPLKYLHLGHMSRVSLVTPLQDPVSAVTFPISRVTSLPDPAFGVTLPQSLYLLTRTCTLGHMFTISRLTPPHQNFYLWSHLHSLQGDIPQMLNLWSHVQRFQGDPTTLV